MYLFFDTETSDLPRDWTAPETDTDNWPRLVQLAWMCTDQAGNVTESQVHLIKPNGFTIAPGAFECHQISTQFALKNGVELLPVLSQFAAAVQAAKVAVAHNVEFDVNVMGAEFARTSSVNPLRKKQLRCTMKESTNYCCIPSSRGLKWPTLGELHNKLFRTDFTGAHDAAADCLACMKCYFRLKKLHVMS